MPALNKAVGIILPLGYGQGPQQASATGYIWDSAGYMAAWGSGSARNFGLTVAAFGFLWASIPGIILVNRAAKRKGIALQRDEFSKAGDNPSGSIEGPDEVPLSESIDKFTLQVCMVGGVYLITIALIIGIEIGFRFSKVPFLIDLVPTIWGFAFMLAALVALCVKAVLRRLVHTGVMHRKYPNSYMMNRISGAAFDLSITAALCLISVTALGTLWIPVLLITSLGGLVTIFYLQRLCAYVYKDYPDEAFLVFYGNLTGTIANGMILLREIDKNFETPASDDIVVGSSAAIVMGIPLLLLIAQAPRAGNLWWVSLAILVYFLVLSFYQLKGGRGKTKV
jgi:ESS family glutamate:Na+ symporter